MTEMALYNYTIYIYVQERLKNILFDTLLIYLLILLCDPLAHFTLGFQTEVFKPFQDCHYLDSN